MKSKNPWGKIVAIGELLIDFVPQKRGMRLEEEGSILKTASGSSGIFACAVACLGGAAGFVGKVGIDPLSKFVYERIKQEGVDVSNVVISDEGQIGLAFIEYTKEGRNYEFYRQNSVGSKFSQKDVNVAYIKEAFAVHYSGMLLELSEEMRSACIASVKEAKKAGVLVSFDPNIRKELVKNDDARKRLLFSIEHADIIAPTIDEAKYITGLDDICEIFEALHKMGPQVIALTRDKEGAVISMNGEIAYANGIDVDAVDPTGAGDTFAAALVYGVQRGYDVEKLARFCNSAGTLCAMTQGVVGLALPSFKMVEQMETSTLCTSYLESGCLRV